MKKYTSSREFVEWVEYMDMEMSIPDKLAYYLAQIAFRITLAFTNEEGARKIKFEDFLLKFKEVKTYEQLTDKEKKDLLKARVEASKAAWMAAVNFIPDDLNLRKEEDNGNADHPTGNPHCQNRRGHNAIRSGNQPARTARAMGPDKAVKLGAGDV